MRRPLRLTLLLLLVAPLVALLSWRSAETVPLYAARTGNLCTQCHFDANGGGPRNEFGFMFARNRHSLEPEGEGSPWQDLNLVNKVGESMPLYFGINQRFMLLANSTVENDSLDRFGFFNMENSIHMAFQPHQALTLVYSRDAFSSGTSGAVENKDAFGAIKVPGDGYLKIGRFRNPFGLRMDDHTVATRNGFLDFSTGPIGERYLPRDPRFPDMGVEYGLTYGSLFGQASYTNGSSDAFFGPNTFAETKAAKVGMNHAMYQGGISFYDDFQKNPSFGPRRSTRWAYYGMTHYGPLVLLGEVGAGTDDYDINKVNLLAWFAEVDYAPTRTLNFRVRADYLNPNRASDETAREANTHYRYSLEGEVVPVPFAEMRWVIRKIDHADEQAFGYDDEMQYYVQAHFSY
jgi:hypothetical protein